MDRFGVVDEFVFSVVLRQIAEGDAPSRIHLIDGYAGREFDSETGVYFNRARYYDPAIGRFVSQDPKRFDAGPNFYAYVGNSSTNLIDPSGLAPCENIGAFVNELNSNAGDTSTSSCATYVRWALEAGGVDTSGHPTSPKDYGSFLENQGFSPVSTDNYTPQAGDVAVIQPYPGGNQNGHIEGWNGDQWVSDFSQNYYPNTTGGGVYPGAAYRNNAPPYAIYRPTPCPTLTPEQSLLQQLRDWIRRQHIF